MEWETSWFFSCLASSNSIAAHPPHHAVFSMMKPIFISILTGRVLSKRITFFSIMRGFSQSLYLGIYIYLYFCWLSQVTHCLQLTLLPPGFSRCAESETATFEPLCPPLYRPKFNIKLCLTFPCFTPLYIEKYIFVTCQLKAFVGLT